MDEIGARNRINAKYESEASTVAERKIALYMRDNFQQVLHSTLLELAEQIGVSDASVVRFCKSLGYKGFQDFKINAALDAAPVAPQHISRIEQSDNAAQICEKVFARRIAALQSTAQAIDAESVELAAGLLENAGRIVFAGTGGSLNVAQDAYHKLLEIGLHSTVAHDKDMQLMEASLLGRGDVLFAISNSGNNLQVIRAVELAKSCGATVLGLTSERRSSLSQMADQVITTQSDETILLQTTGCSRFVQLAVIDCLVAVIAFRRYEKSLQYIYKTRAATSDNKM